MIHSSALVKQLGRVEYHDSYQKMLAFNQQRQVDAPDELWVLEHESVFTQGVSSSDKPRSNPNNIPIVKSDRGGQITYHGPGQLIIYCLLDIKRIGIGPKRLVSSIEQAIINQLTTYGLNAERSKGAPGVYVEDKKIAALGLRIRKGFCYHGLSLNVDMDLSPFSLIDPCGYKGLEVTDLKNNGINASVSQVSKDVCGCLNDVIYS